MRNTAPAMYQLCPIYLDKCQENHRWYRGLQVCLYTNDSGKDMNLDKGADDDVAWGKEVPDFKTEIQSAKQEDDASEQQRDDDDNDEDEDEQKTQHHLAPQYKHLITIRAGKPKGTVADAFNSDPDKVRRLSLSEQELAKSIVNHGTEIVRFTQRNLLRIYPKDTRVTSSNYNPFLDWVHGAQMVPFNMQGYGRALWLMHGFFKANCGCGYLNKPDFLMQNEPEVLNIKKHQPVKKTLKMWLLLDMSSVLFVPLEI